MGPITRLLVLVLNTLSFSNSFEVHPIRASDAIGRNGILENFSWLPDHSAAAGREPGSGVAPRKTDSVVNIKTQFLRSSAATDDAGAGDGGRDDDRPPQSRSAAVKDEVSEGALPALQPRTNPDSYYGDDLSLVFVTPRPRRQRLKTTTTTASTSTSTVSPPTSPETSIESLSSFPTTVVPKTLQSIFTSDPNDYDFIPHLTFNEVPDVVTPAPAAVFKTDGVHDKTLAELFSSELSPAKTADPSADSYGHEQEIDISASSDIITPSFDVIYDENIIGSLEERKKIYKAFIEKSPKIKRRNFDTFRLPSLVWPEDPLLNFLAYGSVLGFAAQGLGLIPFDAMSVDLKGLKRRRRSSDMGYDFNAVNILQWISMLQEVYEKFDYNDVDCQKLLICEVLRDEESFGDVSRRLQGGFELAKYLEVLNMPDEFRELLDEYMDASERSLGQKECAEFFQCPYSLKESVKRNFSGNSL